MSKDRPIRVAIVHYRDDAKMGGSLRVGETIANHINREKVEAHLVFAYGEEGPVASRAHVPCHFIKAKGPTDFSAWLRARALFKDLAPDLIHYQDAIVWLRTALLGTRYKNLLHIHGRYMPEYLSWKNKVLTRAFINRTDAQVCITNGARDALLGLGWTRPEKVAVVYNSVDVDRFSSLNKKKEARARLALPEDVLLLGMVCRLFWAKGCLDLLALLERLPDNWHGVFCGDGPQLPELKRRCEELHLSHRVHFLGNQNNVAPVYESLDAYVFLSRYEPFGLVIAEAMAASVPVFGLMGDGEFAEREYPLVTKENAVFVNRHQGVNQEVPESPEVLDALAQRIKHYGDQPHQYRGMCHQAQEWVSERFDAPVQADAMVHIYEQLSNQGANLFKTPTEYEQLTDSAHV